jgi:AcrR family transcriptional regulator
LTKLARTTPMPILTGRELDGGYAAQLPKRVNQNAARGLKTRLKIIDATIACLYEHGYQKTSTILVTKAAKVSRGSMLNQFPTKADLMMAVAEHIAESRAGAHIAGMEDALDYREKLERLVPILWQEMRGPSGVARIELMLASRSDPDLAQRFDPLNELLEKSHRKVVWALFKALGMESRSLSDAAVHLYAAALRGLSIDLLFNGREQTIENAVALLQSFMKSLFDHYDYHAAAGIVETRPTPARVKLTAIAGDGPQ